MPDFDDARLNLPSGGDRTVMQVTAGLVALRKTPAPDAEMATQSLHGEHVLLHHREGDFGLIQNLSDGYVGWAAMAGLSAPALPISHRVKALRAYVYPRPSIKSVPLFHVSFGAGLVSTGERDGRFLKCERAGWLYEDQLRLDGEHQSDPAAAALLYMHTPYLWGGRESVGIDCSGLVQQAFAACGVTLPRDSDMQGAWAGEAIDDWQAPGALGRNDLVFWQGHVGIMLDSETLLHANGHHMAVASEPLLGSIARISKQYGEPVGARRIDLELERDRKPGWLRT